MALTISDKTLQRSLACAQASPNASITLQTTATKIIFPIEDGDIYGKGVGANYNVSTGLYTMPRDGHIIISGKINCTFTATAAAGTNPLIVSIDVFQAPPLPSVAFTVVKSLGNIYYPATGAFTQDVTMGGCCLYNLVKGTQIAIYANRTTSTSAANINASSLESYVNFTVF